jgi:hypothetical protein
MIQLQLVELQLSELERFTMSLQTFFAFDPQDTDEIRQEKFAALLVAGSCCLAGTIWAAMYYVIFVGG